MIFRSFVVAFATLLAAALATADKPDQVKIPTTSPCRPVSFRYTVRQLGTWQKQVVGDLAYLASPVVEAPAGGELSQHRVSVRYSGSGTVHAMIVTSTGGNLKKALASKTDRSRSTPLRSGQETSFTSSRPGRRYAWILLRAAGNVRITDVRHSALRSEDTIFGHVPLTFKFDGGRLPYRLMFPRNYDPKRKYPLVISVSGSGGVGTDNRKSMEWVILSRFLFAKYYENPAMACFSLVPQIPPRSAIPKGYYPNGPKGAPDRFHPDWPAVNENGWYVQATLALIEHLKDAEGSSIDPDRVYFTGFSYGGKACWEFLKAGRTTFAAAASGGGWPIGGAFSRPDEDATARLKKEAGRYRHIPVYIFAGEKDPMRFGSSAVHKALTTLGGKSVYDEIPGAGHVPSAGRGWQNTKRLTCLFQQNRRKNPQPGADPYPGGVYEKP